MSNMSYCRFQNTLSDLQDCVNALEDGEGLSPEELRAAKQLVDLCDRASTMEPIAEIRCLNCDDTIENHKQYCECCEEEMEEEQENESHK